MDDERGKGKGNDRKKEERQPMSEKECKFAAEKVRNHIQKASENVVDLKFGRKNYIERRRPR
jgi:Ribonuclease G/E